MENNGGLAQLDLPFGDPGFVYFVRAKGTDFYKIGFTTRPIEKRMQEIGTHTPYGLECLLYSPGSLADEHVYHHRLRRYRLHNEWFHITAEDFAFILAENYGIKTDADADAAIDDLKARGLWPN